MRDVPPATDACQLVAYVMDMGYGAEVELSTTGNPLRRLILHQSDVPLLHGRWYPVLTTRVILIGSDPVLH